MSTAGDIILTVNAGSSTLRLTAFGIELEVISDELERQGVQKFIEPYDKLLADIERRRRAR